MGTLYIVATPIGNLEDITIRAIRMLLTVDIVCAEDTRHTGQLLKIIRESYADILGIAVNPEQRLFSYYDEVEEKKAPEVIDMLLQGKTVALVSDAGTPLLNDPGYRLLQACIKEAIPVVPVPGPSSITTALSVSGLPTNTFLYLGYLPPSQQKRRNHLDLLFRAITGSRQMQPTIILFETSQRLEETLEDIRMVFGDVDVSIARELTKVHEEIWRGKISTVPQPMKGEIVILFHPQIHAE